MVPRGFSARGVPRVIPTDVTEREDGYAIECDLPGVAKENVKVRAEGVT